MPGHRNILSITVLGFKPQNEGNWDYLQPGDESPGYAWLHFSRKLFVTTDTELKAIAALAIIGFINHS